MIDLMQSSELETSMSESEISIIMRHIPIMLRYLLSYLF